MLRDGDSLPSNKKSLYKGIGRRIYKIRRKELISSYQLSPEVLKGLLYHIP